MVFGFAIGINVGIYLSVSFAVADRLLGYERRFLGQPTACLVRI